MCRLFGFISEKPSNLVCSLLNAENSLLKQSVLDSRKVPNPDGWGVGFYKNGKIELHKREQPAFKDENFDKLTESFTSRIVIAHVRKATVGEVKQDNAHPFRYRRWLFAHNGTVPKFDEVKPFILESVNKHLKEKIKGTTDSEPCFYLFLSNLVKVANVDDVDLNVERVKSAVRKTIAQLNQLCGDVDAEEELRLNFLVTNGEFIIGTRWGDNTLFYVERHGTIGCEKCMRHQQYEAQHLASKHSVVIASEVLSQERSWSELPEDAVKDLLRSESCPLREENWHEVPENSLITVDREVNLNLEQLL